MNKWYVPFGVVCLASAAHAQILPVSRASRAYAWEHIIDMQGNDHGVVSFERTTAGFEPFDWEFQVAGYTAIQHSSITPSTINVVATAFGNPQSTFGFGGAESSMTFVFDIQTTATYQLEGTVASFIGDGYVSLQGPSVNVLANTPGMQPTPFLFQGALDPGRYTLSVLSTADYGSVTATLHVIPAPGSTMLFGVVFATLRRRGRESARAVHQCTEGVGR